MKNLDERKPKCEACGDIGRIRFDTQGEGYFWLCGSNDGAHSEEFYIGVINMPKVLEPESPKPDEFRVITKEDQELIRKVNKPKPDDESLDAAAKHWVETRFKSRAAIPADEGFREGAKWGEAKGYDKGRADGWREAIEYVHSLPAFNLAVELEKKAERLGIKL